MFKKHQLEHSVLRFSVRYRAREGALPVIYVCDFLLGSNASGLTYPRCPYKQFLGAFLSLRTGLWTWDVGREEWRGRPSGSSPSRRWVVSSYTNKEGPGVLPAAL